MSKEPTNAAEAFVLQFCRRSFLSLWSYANPLGKSGNELCDILVVCDPDVIIVSVKEIGLGNSGDSAVDLARWRKRAIDASVAQVYGAERWLNSAASVIRSDGTIGVPLPNISVRCIHRIAVALGGEGKTPIAMGDFGHGFVHVFDEVSMSRIMGELDTISDFVGYLVDKEKFLSGAKVAIAGAEEDLLAIYLHQGKRFPSGSDTLIVTDGVWDEFVQKEEYKAKKEANSVSYAWDRIIEFIVNDVLTGNLEFGPSLTESEQALRGMAREDRFSRRLLGGAFMEFMKLAGEGKVRSRMLAGPSGVAYVFLANPHTGDREGRRQELAMRCFVARKQNTAATTVIGLATEQYVKNSGFSLDLVYLSMPEWTEENEKVFLSISKELKYFTSPVKSSRHEDEYPK